MKGETKLNFWALLGGALLLLLIVTTPGWKEVLGLSNLKLSIADKAGVLGALLLLAFLGALLFFAIKSGEKSN